MWGLDAFRVNSDFQSCHDLWLPLLLFSVDKHTVFTRTSRCYFSSCTLHYWH
jgi:hypothetical protein